MWNEFTTDPDRMVFFGCMFFGVVVVLLNIGQ